MHQCRLKNISLIKPFVNIVFLGKRADLVDLSAWCVLVKKNVWMLSFPQLPHIHSGVLVVEWLATLQPHAPLYLVSGLLLFSPFPYAIIASLARVPAFTLPGSYEVCSGQSETCDENSHRSLKIN